jgi:predicted dehydrogenase
MTIRPAEPLRVGVIGLGVGEQHVAGFRADPRCRVVAVCDLDERRFADARHADPALRVTTDATALIDDPDLDVVSIASYDDVHYEQALRALERGKHVFVEKPLCRMVDEVQRLARALADRPELVLASNLVLRGAPLFGFAREQRQEGAFGSIYAFDGDYLYGRLHKITDGWRRDVDAYSVLLGGGIHLIDLMLWVTGERPSRVTASGNRISTEGTAFRYLDFAAATYEFPSGLVGRITANFGSVISHRHVVRVFGTKSTLISDDLGPRLYRSSDPEADPERLDLAALPVSKAELIPDFVRRIVDGSRDDRAVRHELDVISACVAADDALAAGTAVEIEYA